MGWPSEYREGRKGNSAVFAAVSTMLADWRRARRKGQRFVLVGRGENQRREEEKGLTRGVDQKMQDKEKKAVRSFYEIRLGRPNARGKKRMALSDFRVSDGEGGRKEDCNHRHLL